MFFTSEFFSLSAFGCRCAELNAIGTLDYEFREFIFVRTVVLAKTIDLNNYGKAVKAEVIVEEQFKGSIKIERFKISVILAISACSGPISGCSVPGVTV